MGRPTPRVGGERFQIALSSKCTWGRCECERPESPDDDAEVRIGRGLKYPKDKGYAKFHLQNMDFPARTIQT